MNSNINLLSKLKVKNHKTRWSSVLGNDKIPDSGVTEIKFKIDKVDESGGYQFGFADTDFTQKNSTYIGELKNGYSYQLKGGCPGKWHNSWHENYGCSPENNDILGCELDRNLGTIWFWTYWGKEVIDHGIAFNSEKLKKLELFPAVSLEGTSEVEIINCSH